MDPIATAGRVTASTAIHLAGRDVLPLLHRISTNALLDLAPGEARATLFCDLRGRLLHRAVVYLDRDGAVWLLRDDAPGAPLAAFVDRHVFREDVHIEDRSGALPVARAAAGVDRPIGVPGRVIVKDEILEIGAPERPAPDPFERIRDGRPAHGHEIVEEFNPFEVGLGGEVHLDKGCYTGQEALQRLTTYRGVRRGLARVEGRGAVPHVPCEITRGGAPVGRLTSVATTPGASGRWIGLAVLGLAGLESSEPLRVEGAPLAGRPELLEPHRPLGRP